VAVATGCPGFEPWSSELGRSEQFLIHVYLLSGVGPQTEEFSVWTRWLKSISKLVDGAFSFTSYPLKVHVVVGCPSNAFAIL
jgi:hypothetical protein